MFSQMVPSISSIKLATSESRFFLNWVLLDEVDSTNDYAKEYSEDIGSGIILTKRQTAGRGRLGRVWDSSFQGAFTLTLLFDILESGLKSDVLNSVTLLVAEGMHRALMSFDDISFSKNLLTIKWPNDIIAGERKISGTLTELVYKDNAPYKLVVGIGLNIGDFNSSISEDLRNAGSIKSEYGFLPSVDEVFLRIISSINQCFLRGTPDFDYINSHAYLNGKKVSFLRKNSNSEIEKNIVKALFIDENCSLVVKCEDGKEEHLISAYDLELL